MHTTCNKGHTRNSLRASSPFAEVTRSHARAARERRKSTRGGAYANREKRTNLIKFLLLSESLSISFWYDLQQLPFLNLLLFNVSLGFRSLLLHPLQFSFQCILFLLNSLMFQMFLDKRRFFSHDFLLQLIDLVVHNLQFAFHLGDLILGLDKVLAVQVAITAHGFVQILPIKYTSYTSSSSAFTYSNEKKKIKNNKSKKLVSN